MVAVMNEYILSDEEALRKTNSRDFNQEFKSKKVFVPKQNKLDLSLLTFEELTEKYAEAMETISSYKSMPSEILMILKDKIVATAKFATAVRIQLKKTSSPEQKLFLADYENLRKRFANYKDDIDLLTKISMLENELKQASDLPSRKSYKEKLANIDKSNKRERLIHINFKRIVKESCGEPKYLSMIREASISADETLKTDEVA